MKRKTASILGVAGVGLVAIVVGAVVVGHRFAGRHVVLPTVAPAGGAERMIDEIGRAFPSRRSQVVVTARVPFAAIRSRAETAAPKAVRGEYAVADRGGFHDIRVRPSIDREAITIEPEVGSAPPKIHLASRFHGAVEVSARRRIAVDLPVVGKKEKVVGATQPNIRIDASVAGWIAPGIDAKWMFTHQEHFDVEVKQAAFKLFGVLPISIRGEVQAAVRRAAPAMIAVALDALRAKLPIRSGVEKVWRRLFEPVKIGAGPDAYIVLTPERVRLQRLAFDDPDHLTIRAAVDGDVRTYITNAAPPATAATPLPDLVLESAIDPRFHVTVPVGLDLGEVNKRIKAMLHDPRIALPDGDALTIRACELYAYRQVLYAKVDVLAESGRFRSKVEGTLFLKCGASYDEATHQLRLKDVDFSTETKNLLADVAAWLLRDDVCRRLEETIKIDVDAELAKARELVNRRYAALKVAPEVTIRPRLDAIVFEGLRLGDGFLLLGFDLSGEIACDVAVPEAP